MVRKTKRTGAPNRKTTTGTKRRRTKPEIAVVGAGAFGGWTALHLLRMGASVTLIDAYGAGDLRAASSGETRVIRAGYGQKPIYAEWTQEALKRWKRFERESGTELFVPSGVLWLCAEEDDYARASLATLQRLRIPFQRLTRDAVERRFPQFSTDGVAFSWFEPQAGFLFARAATQAVAAAVRREGGRVLTAGVEPPATSGGQRSLRLNTGETVEAEQFVFACGSWLPALFPGLLGRRIIVTRQDVFFFGPPPGDTGFAAPKMPVWIDPAHNFYGIPATHGRGLKVADDASGPTFDPATGDRAVSPEALQKTRAYLAGRIPGMAGAPLVESRVCQYARTPDANLVIDRLPQSGNVWIAGGGSGHAFKLGPVLGEVIARHMLGRSGRGRDVLPPMRLGASEWPAGTECPHTRSF